MSIPVEILKAIQCSASKQRHILRDPVLLECGMIKLEIVTFTFLQIKIFLSIFLN